MWRRWGESLVVGDPLRVRWLYGSEFTRLRFSSSSPSSIERILHRVGSSRRIRERAREQDGIPGEVFRRGFRRFRNRYIRVVDAKEGGGGEDRGNREEQETKQMVARERRDRENDIYQEFVTFLEREFREEIDAFRALRAHADLRSPQDWYPKTRQMRRKIIFHCGPTNSGKSFEAVRALLSSSSGVYCAPLRLLALEVYHRVHSAGVLCSLFTGDDQRIVENARHSSCTIEMTRLSEPVDIAVIDEIQMISDPERGWAWTRALLGLQSPEIHVCGEPRALDILQALCRSTGDILRVESYERLTSLEPCSYSLKGDYSQIQEGDCIIAFGRKEIYRIKRLVEKYTQHRCAVVYGSLPPRTRSTQAQRFNGLDSTSSSSSATSIATPSETAQSPSSFPSSSKEATLPKQPTVLVASDAIAMGLNLQIRRIVFSTMEKFDGESYVPLTTSQVLQIAGRAGRFGSKFPDGSVVCMRDRDVPLLLQSFAQASAMIERAGLLPDYEQLRLFHSSLQDTPEGISMRFSEMLDRFVDMSRLDGLFFMCKYDDHKKIADVLEHIHPLSLEQRYTFCISPVDVRDPDSLAYLLKFARSLSRTERVVLPIRTPPDIPRNQSEMRLFELCHHVLDLYMWLSFRYPDYFTQQEQAQMERDLCAELITAGLEIMTSGDVEEMSTLARSCESGGKRNDSLSNSTLEPWNSRLIKDKRVRNARFEKYAQRFLSNSSHNLNRD